MALNSTPEPFPWVGDGTSYYRAVAGEFSVQVERIAEADWRVLIRRDGIGTVMDTHGDGKPTRSCEAARRFAEWAVQAERARIEVNRAIKETEQP